MSKTTPTNVLANCIWACSFTLLCSLGISAQAASGNKSEEKSQKSETVKIKKRPNASYTIEGRKAGVEGRVRLKVTFKSNGDIGDLVDVTRKEDKERMAQAGLTQQAIDAARKIEFEPAKREGKPTTVVKQVEYVFTLY
ncbi:MAG: TonB family protein [Saprospiraceae bacterium]|nr:TonB family protein [Pyrinomonadaceae bacterium]